MSVEEKFGQRLKTLRKQKKMSQDAVSLASGIDRSYLSNIENGKFSPSLDIVNRLARVLDVRIDQLLIFTVNEPEQPYEEN